MSWVWVTAGVVLVVTLLVAALFLVRAYNLMRRPGMFDCQLAESPDWTVREGWGVFRSGELAWYALASLSPCPVRHWSRGELEILSSQRMERAGGVPVRSIEVRAHGLRYVFYVHEGSAAALRSWVESSPPQGESAVSALA